MATLGHARRWARYLGHEGAGLTLAGQLLLALLVAQWVG
jgi:hypothetical protein